MGETTLFNKAGIDQGSADLAATAKAMEQELEELKTYLNQRSQSWEGPAREAYFQAQDQWDKSFTHMRTVLGLSSQAVDQIGQNYQTTEQQNASMWE